MGLGIISALLVIIICLRAVEKRFLKDRNIKIFTKAHKIASILLVVIVTIHLISALQFLDVRPMSIFVTGFVALLFILIALYSGFKISYGNQRKLHKIAAIGVGIFIILHVATSLIGVTSYQSQVSNIEINNIDISKIADGTYIGEYNATYVYAKVEVSVEAGKIININILEHKGGAQGIPAESIIDNIYEEQRINVDTVTGATNSSKVIQSAILNALQNAKN